MSSVKRSIEERFWPKVDVRGPDDCWEWRAATDRHGYGRILAEVRMAFAHRVAYEFLIGPIPEGLTIDHLCRNRACVNPSHMEPVTNRENVLRGVSLAAQHARRTSCLRGHPFDESNTYRPPSGGRRQCRLCISLREQRRGRRLRHGPRDHEAYELGETL